MNYSVYDLLKLIGSLGFFLYGMKLMSEALQKVAGDKMRNILQTMTSNKYMGVVTGVAITAIIQSSSATTVMVVSFVNAGLLTLAESIGVIMGANIGTTVTAWLISLLGFKVDINAFALPLIGLSIFFIFSKNAKKNAWGELIIGFAIIFMGLGFLKNSVPDIHSNPEVLEFFARYSSYGYWSVLIFLFVGAVMTMVIQSSSAAMALTLVMCYNGWINFEMAAGMVMGQNIGTTITANLAAIVANSTAKQAARAHLLFNLLGVFIAMVFFHPFTKLINWICELFGLYVPMGNLGQTMEETNEALPIALSIFHTVFNILNTLILIWFIPQLTQIVRLIVPSKEEDDEKFELKYIKTGLVSVDEIALLQAKNEISVFIERTKKMYNLVQNLMNETSDKQIDKLIKKIARYEEISDKIEEEIANYLTKTSSAELSMSSSETINTMLKLVSRIESLNDACFNISKFLEIKRNSKMKFTPEMQSRLEQLIGQINQLVKQLPEEIKKKNAKIDVDDARNQRDEIDNFIEKLNLLHLKDIKKGMYKYKVGIIYCDVFNELALIGNHAYHSLKYINDLNL